MSLEEAPDTFSQIYQLYIVEGVASGVITAMFKDRVALSTVRACIARACDKAKQDGVPIPFRQVGKGGFKRLSDQKAISARHTAIGHRLNYWRQMTKNMSVKEFIKNFHFGSHIRLRQMEVGVYDFTLTDLHRIAEITSIPLTSLMETPNNNVDPGRRAI